MKFSIFYEISEIHKTGTHYPIIALLRGSHGLSAWRAQSRPEGPQPRSRGPEGPKTSSTWYLSFFVHMYNFGHFLPLILLLDWPKTNIIQSKLSTRPDSRGKDVVTVDHASDIRAESDEFLVSTI